MTVNRRAPFSRINLATTCVAALLRRQLPTSVNRRQIQCNPTGDSLSLELSMTQASKLPSPPLAPVHPQRPDNTKPSPQPTEPNEVLGRHKNSGQKDHKGAR